MGKQEKMFWAQTQSFASLHECSPEKNETPTQ
jgi:hypothetical protein